MLVNLLPQATVGVLAGSGRACRQHRHDTPCATPLATAARKLASRNRYGTKSSGIVTVSMALNKSSLARALSWSKTSVAHCRRAFL